MLNTVGTRFSASCHDNRHWKFKHPEAGWIFHKESSFTLKLYTGETLNISACKLLFKKTVQSFLLTSERSDNVLIWALVSMSFRKGKKTTLWKNKVADYQRIMDERIKIFLKAHF